MGSDIDGVLAHNTDNMGSDQSVALVTDPLQIMRIRDNCNPDNTFGMVRNAGTKAHQGWDLEARLNTPVYAIADGTIEFVEEHDGGDYGKQICLKFVYGGNLTYYAFYAHLSQIYVSTGQEVHQGNEIGLTGNTGNASNLPAGQEHLHFEIRTIPHPGLGLGGRVSPMVLVGPHALSCPAYDHGGDLGQKQDAAF